MRFDSTSVAFTVASDSEIDAVTPAHDPGYVAITVTFPNGESTSRSQAFEYQPSTADIAYVAPPRGPASGGTSVRICLAEHTPVTGVLFGSTPATSFTSDGSQQIDAVSPPGSPGTVDIRVTNNDGTSSATSKDQYTYTS